MRSIFRLAGREPTVRDDVKDELDHHLALKADELVRSGLSRDEAVAEARRQFGARVDFERQTRAIAGQVVRHRRLRDRLDGWTGDARHAVRSLLRAPGFTVTAAVILALGIGSSLAVLGIAHRLLLQPLPIGEVDRVAILFESTDDGSFRLPSWPTVQDWQRDGAGFESIAYLPGTQVGWRRASGVESVLTAFPSPEFFPMVRTRPILGRALTPADDAEAARVAVLGHAFWKRRLGADPGVLGQTLALESGPVTVVGVLPEGFRLPGWADLYLPLATAPADLRTAIALRGNHVDSQVVGRLKPGMTMASAAAAMGVTARRLAEAYPAEQSGWTKVGTIPVRDFLLDPSRFGSGGLPNPPRTVLLFGGAVALVLLIACANVACLTLVRGNARERELAIRAAIGAGRGALIRRLMVESALVAALGGALGVAVAAALIRWIQRAAPDLLPRLEEVRIDPVLIALTIGLAAVAAVASGLVPALRATPRSLADLVKGGGGARDTGSRDRLGVQRSLVVFQLALAVTLTVGAAVLIRSFVRVLASPIGFDPGGMITVSLNPDHARYPNAASTAELYRSVVRAVEAVPGVDAAALSNHLPIGGASMPTRLVIDGRVVDDSSRQPFANFRVISPNYFQVMRIPVLRGRVFTDADLGAPNDGLVVNQALASQHWPGEDPIGRRITVFKSARWLPDFGEPISGVVIGVVGDVRHFGPESNPAAEVYLPYTWNPWAFTGLAIRGRGDPAALLDPIWRAVATVDPDLPVASGARRNIATFASGIERNRAPRVMVTGVATGVAAAALLLALVGLYGVMAYQVGLRRRELGIRAALGASGREILRLVMGQGLRIAVAGVALGLLGGWFATALLRSLVFGVSIRDLSSFVAVPVLLLLVAAVAIFRQARLATRVDPVEVLKGD